MIVVLTAVVGGLGAATRFLVDMLVARWNPWTVPLGTVVVNATASFALGVVTGFALADPALADVRTVIGTGFLGGYSTFSTASVEGARLIRAGRPWAAAAHAGGMAAISVAAALLGVLVASGQH